ncbi:MAG: hypothetical protein FWB86_14660 [Treponema sp.]|nr:hypothetical protein [Treponema sp.]
MERLSKTNLKTGFLVKSSDEIMRVTNEDAFDITEKLSREEGIQRSR